MRKPAVAMHTIMAVASFVVLFAAGAAVPLPAAAQAQDPPECKELGPSSPRCTAARDQQRKDRLTPRACTKYGADSAQCARAMKKKPKAKAKAAAAAS